MSDRSQIRPQDRVHFDAAQATRLYTRWERAAPLAQACDKAGCTEREAEAVLLGANGKRHQDIAAGLRVKHHQARKIVNAGAAKLRRHLGVNERAFAYWKQVMDCQRNSRVGKHTPRESAGLLPYLDHTDYDSEADARAVRAEPRNNREVATVAAVASPGDFQMDALAFLQTICEWLLVSSAGR